MCFLYMVLFIHIHPTFLQNMSQQTTDRMAAVLAQKEEEIVQKEEYIEELEQKLNEFTNANEGFVTNYAQLAKRLGDTLNHVRNLTAEKKALQESEALLQDKASELSKKLAASLKETEIIKNQYRKASSFTDDLRTEHRELKAEKKALEQAKDVAEKQRDEGLIAIKAMFKQHNDATKADNKRLEQENAMLKELNRKTNGDEMRRKVAEVDELKPKLAEARQRIHEGIVDRRKAERELEDRERETRRELLAEREEAALAQSTQQEACDLMRQQHVEEFVLLRESFRQETRKREKESGLCVPCEWQVRQGERCPASFVHQEVCWLLIIVRGIQADSLQDLLAHYVVHAEESDVTLPPSESLTSS